MLKIKEEFDYKSLSRKLETQVDKLIAENERQQKAFDDEVERINQEAQNRIADVESNFAEALEVISTVFMVADYGFFEHELFIYGTLIDVASLCYILFLTR